MVWPVSIAIQSLFLWTMLRQVQRHFPSMMDAKPQRYVIVHELPNLRWVRRPQEVPRPIMLHLTTWRFFFGWFVSCQSVFNSFRLAQARYLPQSNPSCLTEPHKSLYYSQYIHCPQNATFSLPLSMDHQLTSYWNLDYLHNPVPTGVTCGLNLSEGRAEFDETAWD